MNPLYSEIQYLKGVGEGRSKLLNKLGIYKIIDLMEYFPRDYINRSKKQSIRDLELGENAAVIGEIAAIETKKMGSLRSQLHVIITDGSDYLLCTWFHFSKWTLKQFENKHKVWVSGIVTEFHDNKQIIHPEIEFLDEENKQDFWNKRTVLPVYGLTDRLKINYMRTFVYNAFSLYHQHIEETLPEYILQEYHFEERHTGLQKMHFTNHPEDIEETRKRFVFEELFFHQLMLARVRNQREIFKKGYLFELKRTFTTKLKKTLHFELTRAQKKVLNEIINDMSSEKQMNRLLQGDVGSGKTIITIFAMLLAIENGFQAAMMTPTELLAEQHYQTISKFLENQPEIKIALLKGGNYKGKKKIKEDIAAGNIQIIIGTHALIQKDVEFSHIGFVAIDEQHRFGVEQRSLLTKKDKHPDILHLSATPIPRSLALTVYGNLEISILDELPPNRKPVKTIWKSAKHKDWIYSQVKNELLQNRQVYIVCPLIEESEKMDLLDAKRTFVEISEFIFPKFSSSLLHGRMTNKEKDCIMQKFKQGDIKILVSTTVIEVGIDVANATVMIIEHAERFGLSQLHQLRGRVGRGADKSYCYLISHSPITNVAKERLTTMVNTNNGFLIAEKDLDLRGPGDFFGTNQTGLPNFKFSNIVRDSNILKEARILAEKIIKEDFDMKEEKNQVLANIYRKKYSKKEKYFEF